jgi:hypothetical protein
VDQSFCGINENELNESSSVESNSVESSSVESNSVEKYKCECGKVFRDKTDFTRHQNRVTSCVLNVVVKTDYQCENCQKYFSTLSNRNKHTKKCAVVKRVAKPLIEDFYLEDIVVSMPTRDYKWYENVIITKII